MSILSRLPLIPLGFCIFLLLACTCQEVTIPKTSTTPPSVVMLVGAGNNSYTVSNTPVSQVLSPNTPIGLVGIASDNQGVADVQVTGEVDILCTNGNLGQISSEDFVANNPNNSQPGEQACTLTQTGMNASASTSCNGGFSWNSTSGQFSTSGADFSNILLIFNSVSGSKAHDYAPKTEEPEEQRHKETMRSASSTDTRQRLEKDKLHGGGAAATHCTELLGNCQCLNSTLTVPGVGAGFLRWQMLVQAS